MQIRVGADMCVTMPRPWPLLCPWRRGHKPQLRLLPWPLWWWSQWAPAPPRLWWRDLLLTLDATDLDLGAAHPYLVSVVCKKGKGDGKRQVTRRGEETRRDKMRRTATGRAPSRCLLVQYCLLFLWTSLGYDRTHNTWGIHLKYHVWEQYFEISKFSSF